jgi:hypothetical protein
VQDHRVDERARQAKHRALVSDVARAAEHTSSTDVATRSRHAQPSGDSPLHLRDELLAAWDEANALSRATLRRRIALILRQSQASGGHARSTSDALSRAGLGA